MELSSDQSIQVEKTLDLNIQEKKKPLQYKVSSSVLCPKDQLSQSNKQKNKDIDQQEISHEETIKSPLESIKELENILEVVILPSQKLASKLKETSKVTSGDKKKLEREKAQREQILEPTPQSFEIEIRVGQ